MDIPGGWELVLLLVVVVVLFGSARLPAAARSLGRSLRILKSETKGLRDDDGGRDEPAVPSGLPVSEIRAEGTPGQ